MLRTDAGRKSSKNGFALDKNIFLSHQIYEQSRYTLEGVGPKIDILNILKKYFFMKFL